MMVLMMVVVWLWEGYDKGISFHQIERDGML